MKIGEIWKFKTSSQIKRQSFENGAMDPDNDDDLFYVIFPDVIRILKKLDGDLWLVLALYEKIEPQEKEDYDLFSLIPTGEQETHEMTGEQIYKNYDLVHDENFVNNYEEGELYEMKLRDDE